MTHEWHNLTELTDTRPFSVTQVRLTDTGITLEGDFELPLMAKLSYEDQVFVGEFVRCHGSIKHMEKAFGVSYPTIKNRLNRISDQLQLVHIDTEPAPADIDSDQVLDLLESGEITAAEAAERLKG